MDATILEIVAFFSIISISAYDLQGMVKHLCEVAEVAEVAIITEKNEDELYKRYKQDSNDFELLL